MTDLVLIARRRTQVDSRTHYPGCERDHTECLIQRMADEIERRDEWRECMAEEIERLHADNQAAVAAYAAEITEAKAEIERLRDCISAREVRSLVDERDRLRAERDDVRAELSNLQIAFNEWMRSETERQVQKGKRLDEEIGRLRPDAERYRWLRTQHWESSPMAVVANPKDAIKLGHHSPSDDLLDAAIDAAMKEGK